MKLGHLFLTVVGLSFLSFILFTFNIKIDSSLHISGFEFIIIFARVLAILSIDIALIYLLIVNWDKKVLPLKKRKSWTR